MMSDNKAPEAENWLTSSEASLISGYNTAYLTRLAKQGHLLARRQGRNWQIDYLSLKAFIAVRKKSTKQRNSELKIQRLAEFYPSFRGNNVSKEGMQDLEVRIFNLSATLSSFAVLMLGALLGILMNASSEFGLTTKDLHLGANNIAGVIQAALILGD